MILEKEGPIVKLKSVWKKACLLSLGAAICSSVCLAAIPYTQVLIGGVGPGSSMDYVKSIYGQPASTNFDTPAEATYTYGNSFVLTANASTNTVYTVLSSGHNGLNTPAGVGVGMDASVITEKYGTCERIGNVNGVTYYHYAMEPNPAMPNDFGGFSFGVENGKIISIWAGVVPDESAPAAPVTAPATAPETVPAAAGTPAAATPVTPADSETVAKTIPSHNEAATAPAEPAATTSKVTTAEGTKVSIEKDNG